MVKQTLHAELFEEYITHLEVSISDDFEIYIGKQICESWRSHNLLLMLLQNSGELIKEQLFSSPIALVQYRWEIYKLGKFYIGFLFYLKIPTNYNEECRDEWNYFRIDTNINKIETDFTQVSNGGKTPFEILVL